jgi:hypothetical protein
MIQLACLPTNCQRHCLPGDKGIRLPSHLFKLEGVRMTVAAVFLALAALGGLTMVIMRLKGTPLPPTGLALAHGGIAAIGVIILAYTAATAGIPQLALIALGIFVVAALGGLAIFVLYHAKNRPLPVPLILGHGIIAIVGFVLLVLAIYQGA